MSKRAASKLEMLLLYLETEWSLKIKENFIAKLDNALRKIQHHPASCPRTNHVKGIHLLVITRQTSLFYRFDEETIIVVSVFDNRMYPSKIMEGLK